MQIKYEFEVIIKLKKVINLIGCITENGVAYITKLEDFRDLMSEDVYQALEEFLNIYRIPYQYKIEDLESELFSAQEDADMSDLHCDELETEISHIRDTVQDLCMKIQDSINWKYDLYSGYQDMMQKIDELVDKINDAVE